MATFVYPTWPSATILNSIEPEIAPFDPSTRKFRAEPNTEWIGCTVCDVFAFKLYCDLETGFGVTQGHRKRHYSIEHIRLYNRLP